MLFKRALVLAPHTDDGELGCGATIANLLRHGTEVYYVAFSSCKDSLPEGWEKDALVKEMHEATKVLGIKEENTRVLDFSVRHFEDHRQEVLDAMLQIGKKINPDKEAMINMIGFCALMAFMVFITYNDVTKLFKGIIKF